MIFCFAESSSANDFWIFKMLQLLTMLSTPCVTRQSLLDLQDSAATGAGYEQALQGENDVVKGGKKAAKKVGATMNKKANTGGKQVESEPAPVLTFPYVTAQQTSGSIALRVAAKSGVCVSRFCCPCSVGLCP